MSYTIEYTELLESTGCWCGIALAVPQSLLRHAHNGGTSIYCPLGHQFSWHETEAMRLRKKLAEEQEERHRQMARAADAERTVRRLERRIKRGVCPCCTRTFVNVERHIASKHPEFAEPVKAKK